MRSGSSSQFLLDLKNVPSFTKGLLLDEKFYFLISFYRSIVYCLIQDWSFSSKKKKSHLCILFMLLPLPVFKREFLMVKPIS